MAFLHADVYDNGLSVLAGATALHLCSQEPANLTQATTTYSLANKATPSVGAPGVRSGGGREVVVAAISSGGTVTATGTATHWALVDGTRLLAAGALNASQALTNGNTFTLTSFAVGITAAT